MKIEKNKNLKNLNTFGVGAKAKYFATVKNVNELKQVLQSKQFNQNKKHMILGGGSNILFVNDYGGFLIKNEIKGIEVVKITKTYTYIKFGAGEVWDDCVKYAVDKNLGGIENLTAVPGTAGGAAVQNIACYDQNLDETFYKLTAINTKTLKQKVFSKKECKFTYRSSRFKKDSNNWAITSITLKLSKNPVIDTKYYEVGLNKTSVQQELESLCKPPYTVKCMYKTLTSLRKKRIPSEKIDPNPGSFFRNPVISKKQFIQIKKSIPTLQYYTLNRLYYPKNNKLPRGAVKISYGQLIDLGLGLKGTFKGNVGIHPKHAAFIYTNGKASGKEIHTFSESIKKRIYNKYGIKLKEEVRIIL